MNGFPHYPKDSDALPQNVSSANGFNTYASTSQSPYPDFANQNNNHQPYANSASMRHSQGQQSHSMPQQDQWAHMMPQNSHHQQHQQHHHHPHVQNTPQYNNNAYLPNQSYANGMGGGGMAMGGYNAPYYPPQVLQEAMALSAPVEMKDEQLLVQALLKTQGTRDTYKDALNALHGRNNHSASLWKDYYLDHKHRIDEVVFAYLKPKPVPHNSAQKPPPVVTQKAVKRPSPDSFKVEESSPVVSHSAPSGAKRKGRASVVSAVKSRPTQSPVPPPTGSGRRSTINSLTVHTPAYAANLPPPNMDIKIPEPPSRSPTPPTKVVPHNGRGNKFTPEDREYFIKFISWRLQEDSSLGRHDLCELLSEKAPHHSTQSWASFWSNNHDLPDKILAAAAGESEEEDEDEEDESEVERVVARRRPKYKESSSEADDQDDDDDEDEDAEGDEDVEEDQDEEVGNVKLPASYDESAMGQKGGSFTEADFAICARHVASFPDFREASFTEKWVPFGDKYPQRSAKSWAEYYRRNERGIEKLAKSIRKLEKNAVQKSSPLQGKPSWTSSTQEMGAPPKAKRKFAADEDEDEESSVRSKQGRHAGNANGT